MTAVTAKWTAYGSPDTLMVGASMYALASGSAANGLANSGVAIDNSTSLEFYMDIQLVLSSAVTCGSSPACVSIYLIPSVDGGTTYPTPPGTSAVVPPSGYFAGNIVATSSASFTSGILRGVIIPPGKFYVVMVNVLGVTLPATNTNALTGNRYQEQAA